LGGSAGKQLNTEDVDSNLDSNHILPIRPWAIYIASSSIQVCASSSVKWGITNSNYMLLW
jgi:hypothetical protein